MVISECANESAEKSVGENPIYAKSNQQHRSNYCIAGGDEYDEANRNDISGYNVT